MTENRRIFWNVVATYARSLFALVCGLLTGRWVLMALGEVDYGLYGVVGGLTAFIVFFNGILASSVGRFYTVSVGAAKVAVSRDAGLDECRAWFNTAVSVHFIVPIVLMCVGYPVGVWVIKTFLTIPADRIESCLWVFRFVCISCFVGMANVPFQAMYRAKQYIAELTIYGFATTALNVVFLYLMVSHPGDWLVRYALWTCLLSVVPQAIICIRAMKIFPECVIRRSLLFKKDRLKQLGAFASWQMLGTLSAVLRGQGMAIVINKSFGPRVNAAQSVAGSVDAHSSTLSSSMLGAFAPAITTAYGAGDIDRMHSLAMRACKFGTWLSLIFVLPLALELQTILELWLKNPPMYTYGFTLMMLLMHLVENLTYGHMISVSASGRIALYQSVMGIFTLTALPIAIIWILNGGGPYAVVWSLFLTQIGYTIVRVVLARRIVGLSLRYWFFKVVWPLTALASLCVVSGMLVRPWLNPGIWRIVCVAMICEIILFSGTWLFVFDVAEREYVWGKISPRLRFVK